MTLKNHGTGWLVDHPDIRDYTPKSNKVTQLFGSSETPIPVFEVPKSVDYRKWCSPIKDQGMIGSCTAHAAVAMYEYMENRVHDKHIEGSELFVYKNTRMLMATRGEAPGTGDTGASIRAALGSLVLFGMPPEDSYPYIEERYDDIPNNFAYSLAQNYQVEQYLRLDHDIKNPQANLHRIREWVAKGFPVEFGFTCYREVLKQAEKTGIIAFPSMQDVTEGGHAVMICGYDNDKNAFLIKNSWGTGWGDEGYGWLSYDYVLSGHGLAQDFWTTIKVEWVDQSQFHF